jgi:hypothetical protein
MTSQACRLLDSTDAAGRRVRLLGMGISNFASQEPSGTWRQLHLPFADASAQFQPETPWHG